MIELARDTPVGEWAVQRPGAIEILEGYGVDYCCGGEKALADACLDAGVDLQRVFDELNRPQPQSDSQSPSDWCEASLTELCDHIEQTHHAFLREQLPQLTERIAKVVAAHGEKHPVLSEVQSTFLELRAELERVREQGFATCFEERKDGANAIAVPLAKPDGTVVATLSIVGHAYSLTHEKAMHSLEILRGIATEISLKLG